MINFIKKLFKSRLDKPELDFIAEEITRLDKPELDFIAEEINRLPADSLGQDERDHIQVTLDEMRNSAIRIVEGFEKRIAVTLEQVWYPEVVAERERAAEAERIRIAEEKAAARERKSAVEAEWLHICEKKSSNPIFTENEAVKLKCVAEELGIHIILDSAWDPITKENIYRLNPDSYQLDWGVPVTIETMYSMRVVEPDWYLAFTPDFKKSLKHADRKLQGLILNALTHLVDSPSTPFGDTVKPLSKELRGLWRYRIGNYRLIYRTDENSKHIYLLSFAHRSSAYDA